MKNSFTILTFGFENKSPKAKPIQLNTNFWNLSGILFALIIFFFQFSNSLQIHDSLLKKMNVRNGKAYLYRDSAEKICRFEKKDGKQVHISAVN